MEMEEKKIELLHEAFSQFNSTSLDLERCYRLLEVQVRQLNVELEEKNKLLKATIKEKEALRAQAERNLRLAAVGEMAARMAHELRNPLGSIELFASLLKKGLAKEPDKVKWAEHISSAVMAMDYSLTNLLLFTGKPTPNFRRVDIGGLVSESRIFASHLIQQNQIEFVQEIGPMPELFLGDEDLLRQVFLNLILNAVDAMPQGGQLRVAASSHQMKPEKDAIACEGVMVTISDTGCGIPQEALSKIFDPFFTTKDKGTGLGLAIVHNAVQAHNGLIHVQSELKKGTTFTLTFPVKQAFVPDCGRD